MNFKNILKEISHQKNVATNQFFKWVLKNKRGRGEKD